MKRRILIAVLLAAATATAHGESTLLVLAGRVTDNEFIFGRNAASPAIRTQRVLSTTNRSLLGLTPADSVLKADPSITVLSGGIDDITKMSGQPIVITADNHLVRTGALVQISDADGFESAEGIWIAEKIDADSFRLRDTHGASGGDYTSGGTWSTPNRFVTAQYFGDETPPALISGLTIDGQKHTVGLQDIGQGANSSLPFVSDGIELENQLGRIEGNFIKGFRGSAVVAGHVHLVRNNQIGFGFTGIKVASADVMVTDNIVYAMRDAGLWVAQDSGNCSSNGNHYFGCNNGDGGSPIFEHQPTPQSIGAACRIDGAGSFHGTSDIYADSYYGVYCGGWVAQFSNCFFQHNTHRDVLFLGAGCELHGCVINAMRRTTEYPNTVSVEFANERCGMFGGSLEMTSEFLHLTSHSASVGFKISGDNCRVQTRLIDNDGLDGTTGVHIAAAVKGSDLDIRTWGFHQTNERIVKVDSSVDPVGVRWVFRGEGIDTVGSTETDGIKKYIDIDTGWSGSIEFVNTTTGASIQLTEGAAY
jgi:hypothetical protein